MQVFQIRGKTPGAPYTSTESPVKPQINKTYFNRTPEEPDILNALANPIFCWPLQAKHFEINTPCCS